MTSTREESMKRAQAALAKFRSMSPMLTSFMRGITGDKKIRLVAGAETKSNRDMVMISPPVALGAEYHHPSRRSCGQRNLDGIPVCAGCRAWEGVFVSLLHEMSHVAFTKMESASFNSAYSHALPKAQEILEVEGGPFTKAQQAKKVDPYFPMVANALENIRVDSAMVEQRPGVEAMQHASYNYIMSGDFEIVAPDGGTTLLAWADAEPTAQVIVSLIAMGLGYGVHESMKPEVAEFVSREDIARMCVECIGATLETVIIRTAEVIKAGREEGFFPLDENGDPESGEGGEEGEGEGQSGSIPQELLEQLEAALEQAHDASGSEARDEAAKSGGMEEGAAQATLGGDPGDDRATEMVIKQDGWTDSPTTEFEGVDYAVWSNSSRQDCGVKPSESVLGSTLGKLRAVLAPNQYHNHTRHMRAGRLDSRVLGRRAPVGDDRLFMRKQDVTKRDFFFVLGLDVSGSTANDSDADSSREVIDVIVSAAWAQAELLHRLGVPFTIVTHTATGGWGKGLTLELREVKGPDEPWNSTTQARLQSISPQMGNLDARAMVAFRKIAERHPAREKFIIQYSDGAFPVSNVEDEERVIGEEIEIHRRTPDLHFMMVGIECSSPERFGFDFVRVDSEAETMNVVNQIERAIR